LRPSFGRSTDKQPGQAADRRILSSLRPALEIPGRRIQVAKEELNPPEMYEGFRTDVRVRRKFGQLADGARHVHADRQRANQAAPSGLAKATVVANRRASHREGLAPDERRCESNLRVGKSPDRMSRMSLGIRLTEARRPPQQSE
jgi:hypothetical protein